MVESPFLPLMQFPLCTPSACMHTEQSPADPSNCANSNGASTRTTQSLVQRYHVVRACSWEVVSPEEVCSAVVKD